MLTWFYDGHEMTSPEAYEVNDSEKDHLML